MADDKQTTLYRELGPRGTPIFGKIPQRKRRRK